MCTLNINSVLLIQPSRIFVNHAMKPNGRNWNEFSCSVDSKNGAVSDCQFYSKDADNCYYKLKFKIEDMDIECIYGIKLFCYKKEGQYPVKCHAQSHTHLYNISIHVIHCTKLVAEQCRLKIRG